MVIWYILWPFGTFYGYLVYFSRFGILRHEQSGNPEAYNGGIMQDPISMESGVLFN
jgi:hypothetical protein